MSVGARFASVAVGGAMMLAASRAWADPVRIRLKPEAEVASAYLRLDQLVEAGSDSPLARPLSGIYLGAAPEGAKERVVSREEVWARLHQMGADRDSVEILGGLVVVRRASRPKSGAERVVVAAKDLAAGTVLAPEDMIERERLPDEAVEGPEGIAPWVGKALRRGLAAGCEIRACHVQEPLCVRRGEVVRVLAKSSGTSIGFRGKAAGDGRLGERVRVDSLRDPGVFWEGVATGKAEVTVKEGQP